MLYRAYAPSLPETVCCEKPVRSLVRLTVTPGSGASAGSRTRPRTTPASAVAGRASDKTPAASGTSRTKVARRRARGARRARTSGSDIEVSQIKVCNSRGAVAASTRDCWRSWPRAAAAARGPARCRPTGVGTGSARRSWDQRCGRMAGGSLRRAPHVHPGHAGVRPRGIPAGRPTGGPGARFGSVTVGERSGERRGAGAVGAQRLLQRRHGGGGRQRMTGKESRERGGRREEGAAALQAVETDGTERPRDCLRLLGMRPGDGVAGSREVYVPVAAGEAGDAGDRFVGFGSGMDLQ